MEHFKKTQAIYEDYCTEDSARRSCIPPSYKHEFDFSDEYALSELENDFKHKIKPIFEKEYEMLVDNYEFFWGCTFDVYLRDYDKRLNEFNTLFKDALLIDFIEQEAGKLINYGAKFYWMVWDEKSLVCKNIDYSKTKKRNYLIDEALKLGYHLEFDFDHEYKTECFSLDKLNAKPKNALANSNIYWNANQTDFMELVKALIESEAIKDSKEKGKQKELTTQLSNLFNIKINNPDKLITDFNKRNNGKETKFIDSLKKHLFDFIQG